IGNLPHQGIACLGGSSVVSVPDPAADAVDDMAFRLSPNPSRAGTVIEYALPTPAHVTIRVYDLQGRTVARVADEFRAAGRHQASWSGRAASGAMSPGLYFVRFEAAGRKLTKALVLTR